MRQWNLNVRKINFFSVILCNLNIWDILIVKKKVFVFWNGTYLYQKYHCLYEFKFQWESCSSTCQASIEKFSSVQSHSRVWLFVTPRIAEHQASLSITNAQSFLKLMSMQLVMSSSPVIHPLMSTHPLSSPSPPAFNPSQHQGPFQWISSSHQVAEVLKLQVQHQSFQWIFRTDFL